MAAAASRSADYTPSASGEKAIQRMMDQWREDDRKLEMEERDRARRASEMRRQGEVLLEREDEAVGVAILPPPERKRRRLRGEEAPDARAALVPRDELWDLRAVLDVLPAAAPHLLPHAPPPARRRPAQNG